MQSAARVRQLQLSYLYVFRLYAYVPDVCYIARYVWWCAW